MTSNAGLNSVAGGLGRMADCELRAVLPGFFSDVISLANRRVSNTSDLGTIVLHRLANVDARSELAGGGRYDRSVNPA